MWGLAPRACKGPRNRARPSPQGGTPHPISHDQGAVGSIGGCSNRGAATVLRAGPCGAQLKAPANSGQRKAPVAVGAKSGRNFSIGAGCKIGESGVPAGDIYVTVNK
jgi:hypothetical protein